VFRLLADRTGTHYDVLLASYDHLN